MRTQINMTKKALSGVITAITIFAAPALAAPAFAANDAGKSRHVEVQSVGEVRLISTDAPECAVLGCLVAFEVDVQNSGGQKIGVLREYIHEQTPVSEHEFEVICTRVFDLNNGTISGLYLNYVTMIGADSSGNPIAAVQAEGEVHGLAKAYSETSGPANGSGQATFGPEGPSHGEMEYTFDLSRE